MRYPTALPAVIRYVLATHLVVFGLLYCLGPPQWYSSSRFAVTKSLGVPIWVWGLMFLIAGVLLYLRQLVAGHAAAAVLLLFWGTGQAVSALQDQLSGVASTPVHCFGLAAVHLWALHVRIRERAGAGG